MIVRFQEIVKERYNTIRTTIITQPWWTERVEKVDSSKPTLNIKVVGQQSMSRNCSDKQPFGPVVRPPL
jgi:hypothetical protein